MYIFFLTPRLIPYGCLSTGKDVGLIEVVKNAKTITAIQSKGGALSSIQIDSSQLHKWIREQNPDRWESFLDFFLLDLLVEYSNMFSHDLWDNDDNK